MWGKIKVKTTGCSISKKSEGNGCITKTMHIRPKVDQAKMQLNGGRYFVMMGHDHNLGVLSTNCGKIKTLLSSENISSNHLFSNFSIENVAFTKFLPK